MKKLFSVILIVTLLMSSATFAAESSPESIKSLSYEEAVEEMLRSNPELKSLKDQIDIQKAIVEDANQEANRLKFSIFEDEKKISQRANTVYLDPTIAEITLSALKRSYEEKVFELKESIFDYMLDHLNKTHQLNLSKKQVDIEEKNYFKNKNELKLGKITKSDLLTSEISLQTAKNALEMATRDVEMTLSEFNYVIHQTLTIRFTPDFSSLEKKIQAYKIDLDALDLKGLSEKNMATDSLLASYKEDLKKFDAQIQVERVYPSGVNALKELDKKIMDTTHLTKKRKTAITYKVFKDYNDLKMLMIDLKLAENNEDLAAQNLKAQSVLHQLKRVTDLDLLKAEKNLTEATNRVRESQGKYYKALQAFLRFY